MLADYARTDNHRLRRVEPAAQPTRELAALVRARTALVQARTAASNQLWAILAEHWPGAALIFQKLTSPIALAFLTDYPTPQSARHLGEGRMLQFCHRHSYRGGKSPAELVRRLRAAPAGPAGFRYTANKQARVAITSFAVNSRHSSAWAGDCYHRARLRGARHPHAVRIVARGWVRVIWACWTTDTVYDPLRHSREQ